VIPHLRTLCFGGNRFGVPPEFAETYVKIHACPGRDGWGTAEEHWEQVVDRVFNTDAVKPDAQGDIATVQAVAAAVELLNMFAKRGQCPQCPVSTPPPPEEHGGRECV
jgi:hypothetical protein